jgi:hypothetical protein
MMYVRKKEIVEEGALSLPKVSEDLVVAKNGRICSAI